MDFANSLKSKPMERYQKLDKLGEGTYGVVYKARDKLTDEVTIPFLPGLDSGTQEDQTGEGRGRSALDCDPGDCAAEGDQAPVRGEV